MKAHLWVVEYRWRDVIADGKRKPRWTAWRPTFSPLARTEWRRRSDAMSSATYLRGLVERQTTQYRVAKYARVTP